MRLFSYLCVIVFTTHVVILVVEAQAATPPAAAAGDSDVDPKMYEMYKNQVCGLVPAFSGGDASSVAASPWSDELTEKEILELAFVNMAYGLTSDSVSHMKSQLGWKKSVIDKLSLITKATCMDHVVSEPFLNAAKNLFLYYMVKMMGSASNGTTPTAKGAMEPGKMEMGSGGNDTKMELWMDILKSLHTCSTNMVPIAIDSACGKAISFTAKDGSVHPIMDVVEQFDTELSGGGDMIGLDIIIDTVWWMFSTAYARCYAFYYPNEDEILIFYQMFKEDFLEPFTHRWRSAGPASVHFPLVFGPYDSMMAAENARKCASAAYDYEDLGERQLVRPVNVVINNNYVRNFKVAPM